MTDQQKNKYILAIDHGTSGIKAAIVSTHGQVMDYEYEKTAISFLPDGGAEQDPDDWWQALLKACSRLVANAAVNPKDIVAIAVSSTFSTTVAVDKHGKHLMNALTWMDSRGAPYVKKIVGGFPSIDGYGIFRIMKWIPKTGGGPTLSGKDDIAHVLLIKNEFADVYKNTHMFLPSKDYLNLKLTGNFAASYDSMQLFWVSDIRDIHNISYDEKLISLLDLDPEKLPPMAASTDTLGTVRKDIAETIGISSDVKVVLCSPDHQTACIGSGAVDDFAGHLYIGTSSWIQAVIPFKKTDVFHSIASFPTAIPGKYQSVNEQDMAGGCLSHLFDNILFYDNELKSDQIPDPYAHIDDIAGRVTAGSHNLIFLPWLNGERTPVDDTNLRAGFFNMSKTTTQDHMIRAVMEGVAYNTRWSLKYVERFIKQELTPINFIGGGAQSDVWCQIFADVLNRDIRQVENPRQANARGAAFIASVGLGYITFDDIPHLTKIQKTFYPNPDNRKTYDELYNIFIRLYRKNKSLYRRLNTV
ncbi:MAG: xylulose kinase [Desulfobacteraceae bacterium]|nr:xylulose kinase [Desulfobacteraceae bacterium]MBC2754307.1 xylulose kinase [Desulfobacteraceae bacterium]